MRDCELCNNPARMYCESDQASLCWECDAKVHCANFLVARHSRNLLCHICQSPTPWKASGAKLGPTISVCDLCARPKSAPHHHQHEEGNDETEDRTEEDEDEEEDVDCGDEVEEDEIDALDEDDSDEDADGDDEEDGENQVVPWSSTPPPPPIPSSSSSEESSSRLASASTETALPLKRQRENADLASQDDLGCSSSQRRAVCSIADESMPFASLTPLGDRKKSVTARSESRPSLIESLQRLKRESEVRDETDVLDLCNLRKDTSAVDLVSPASP